MIVFLQSLDLEWHQLCRSAAARRALMGWSARHDAMRGLYDLAEVLDARRDRSRAGEVLRALAALAPTDDLAARALLQALLPGLVRLSRYVDGDDPNAVEELVSLGWERIRTYPPERQGSVAGNVLLDVRKRYVAHRRIEHPKYSMPILEDVTLDIDLTESEVLGRLLLAEMVNVQRAGLISPRTLSWIVRTRLLGDSVEEIAAEVALPDRVVTQQRWRGERRLRAMAVAG